jgi:acetolactate synthase-1/2/3 large subunit
MKLTDCLANVLKSKKINHVFGLQGGAVVHMFDSLEKKKIGVTYTNHEQSAALAAVSYAKCSKNTGCVVVTTGPATTNSMTGLLAAWQDSVPCLFISGQSRSEHTSYGKKVRQVGTQEVNICDIVRPITKYSKFIDRKENFLFELEKAIDIANEGRKGPVWLDIPLEFQWADIEFKLNKIKQKKKNYNNKINQFGKLLTESRKPLIVIGYGARSSEKTTNDLKIFIKKYKIPFTTTWNACDIFGTNHNLNLGIIGMSGQRGANKAMFKADLIICIGTHLSIPHTTTLFDNYAKQAKKIIVNIDQNQLNNLNVKFDLKIRTNLEFFLKKALKKKFKFRSNWNDLTGLKDLNWYEPKNKIKLNSNTAIRMITSKIKDKKCIVIDGGGTALYAGFQSSFIKSKDRVICSSAIASMGTGLAETIGAAKSKKFEKFICIIGDGSFLMNIQDLQTISQEKIKVLILLVNNNGYLAIRHTQKEFLKSKFYGTHPDWKLTMPSFEKVTKSFGLNYVKLKNKNDLIKNLTKIKNFKGPTVCELITDENQDSLFKQGYKSNNDGTFTPQPLSEMYPFLDKYIANTNN